MVKRRMESPETIDVALHWLMKLQSEGWALAGIEYTIAYLPATKHSHRTPSGATLIARLVPQ